MKKEWNPPETIAENYTLFAYTGFEQSSTGYRRTMECEIVAPASWPAVAWTSWSMLVSF
jgi:hypothetical protein